MLRLNRMAAKVPRDAPWTAERAHRWDSQTTWSWMQRNMGTRSGRTMLELAVKAVWAAMPADVSLLHLLFYISSAGSLERLLDTVTVLVQLAAFVLLFGDTASAANPVAFSAVKWAGASAGAIALVALAILFVLAGDPARFARTMARLEHVVPSALAGVIARIAEKFARGLGIIRRPGRLLTALALSVPLWLSIDLGIWAVAMAFGFAVPFTGSFVVIALLVLGVAVPTPGAIGGFHAAFRYSATAFFGAPDAAAVGAAIVLHLVSIGPSLLLGLMFAAQEGLNVTGMRRLADEQRHTA